MCTSSSTHSIRSGSVTKYGERYPRSNCIPSTTSRVVSMVRDSSTVMTPSLPTFFMASAMMLPICRSLLAEIVPTCAIMSPLTSRCSFLISSTAASTAFSMPRLSAVGLAPAATVFTPSRKMAWASTVAVVVPSPATSEVFEATSRTICAPMFSSGSCSSISFATVTPSLVMIGAPNFFSITAFRPLGPRVIFTASARALTPRRIDWREFSPVTICFAMSHSPLQNFLLDFPGLRPRAGSRTGEKLPFAGRGLGSAGKLGKNFVFTKNQVIFVFYFNFGATVFAKQHPVAGLYVEGNALTLLDFARASCNHFALLRLLFGRIGDDDSALDCLFFLNPLDQHAIMQRSHLN